MKYQNPAIIRSKMTRFWHNNTNSVNLRNRLTKHYVTLTKQSKNLNMLRNYHIVLPKGWEIHSYLWNSIGALIFYINQCETRKNIVRIARFPVCKSVLNQSKIVSHADKTFYDLLLYIQSIWQPLSPDQKKGGF